MSHRDSHLPLAGRIAAVERELLDLRRSLLSTVEELPPEPFSVLDVRIGGTWYAMPASHIREVVLMVMPTPLPESPPWVRGTIQYGDRVIPMIDLHHRLHRAESQLSPSAFLVISEPPDQRAFMIDALRNVYTVSPGAIQPPLAGIPQGPYLLGTLTNAQFETVHILSVQRLSRDGVFL